MGLIFLIVLCVAIFLYVKFILGNYHFKFDFITILVGQGGAGKTTLSCAFIRDKLKSRARRNFFRRILNIFLIKRFKLDYECMIVYSTFPIYLGKKYGWSKVITKRLLTWDYKVEKGSLIVLDELAYLFPSRKEVPTLKERFCLTFLRHVLGRGCEIIGATQSLSRCNIALRSVVSHTYNLSNCRKGFIFSKVNVMDVMISEDINTIYNDTSRNFRDNVYRFRFPKKMFVSDYGKYFENIPSNYLENMDSYDYIFNLFGLKCGMNWFDYYIRPVPKTAV